LSVYSSIAHRARDGPGIIECLLCDVSGEFRIVVQHAEIVGETEADRVRRGSSSSRPAGRMTSTGGGQYQTIVDAKMSAKTKGKSDQHVHKQLQIVGSLSFFRPTTILASLHSPLDCMAISTRHRLVLELFPFLSPSFANETTASLCLRRGPGLARSMRKDKAIVEGPLTTSTSCCLTRMLEAGVEFQDDALGQGEPFMACFVVHVIYTSHY
jgi:hypothetical protein